MSGVEDDYFAQQVDSEPFDQDIDDNEEDQPEQQPRKAVPVAHFDEEEDEEGDANDEEEDDEDEEDDKDEDDGTGRERERKRAKHRHKRPAVNRFLDVEAEVDEDEDEDEDEEEYGRDEFIADAGIEGDEEDVNRRAAVNARLDRRERELDDQDLAKIAQNLHERYGRAAVRYTGDMNEVPQRLLMPSVHDANLWQVRVKPGRERDIVFSLMRKAIDFEYTAQPLQVLSAFQRDSLPGMIYVESRSSQQVNQACKGLVGIYPSRGITLVPIEEMASLLQIKKQDLTVTPGSWVRIKRGKYQGDLAQVMDITENGEDVGLKFIPRIDLNPKDEASLDGRKRKKIGAGPTTMRPPQRFFNYEEVVKVYGRKQVSKRNQVYVFQNDTYKDGFIEKDFKLSALVLENVNPTLDEITRFTRGQDGAENENPVDLSIIAEASRKAAISVLQPGDHVEVFEGEQAGVHGVVDSINQEVVTITAVGVDIDGQKIDLPARSVRKRFKPGDHVKVMAGQNADETGLVVSVSDNVVTFLSDMSMQEVSVFSKDLREAAEVGSGTNIVGNYELHDLVQLDLQTVGVIFKTERDSFRVLDQNGQVRLVQPHQISMRRNSDRAIATDSEGHEIRTNDNVKEVDGEARKGRVLHTYQSFFAFLHNRDIAENGGVFVTRARSLASLAPKGTVIKHNGADLSKMNPALAGGAQTGGMVGSGTMGRGPRDRLIGVTVAVVKGAHKGYVGAVKDTNGPIARVELHTGNKVITIEKEKLRRRNNDGSLEPLEGGNYGMGPPRSFNNNGGHNSNRTSNPYQQSGQAGGRTPGWGRTPNPYAGGEGRTPGWNQSSRTPNPFGDGGKTPAWNASSRTPNPYQDSGKTPAWNASSRTPNPYTSGDAGGSAWGSATPKPNGWGGATPKPAGWGGATPRPTGWGGATPKPTGWGGATPKPASWGGQSPARPVGESSSWGISDPSSTWNSTPAAAATPGYIAAQTPSTGYIPARTPADIMFNDHIMSAPTPAPGILPSEDDSNSWSQDNNNHNPNSWLQDNNIRNKHVIMEINNTRLSGWRGGNLEQKQGYILSSMITGNDATAQFCPLDSDLGEGPITVPLSYLAPVRPQHRDERAIIFDGPYRGEEVVLRVRDEDDDVWTVGKYQDALSPTITCAVEKMVKLHV